MNYENNILDEIKIAIEMVDNEITLKNSDASFEIQVQNLLFVKNDLLKLMETINNSKLQHAKEGYSGLYSFYCAFRSWGWGCGMLDELCLQLGIIDTILRENSLQYYGL